MWLEVPFSVYRRFFAGQHRLAVRERGKISNSNSRNGNPSNEPCCFQKSTELFKVTSSYETDHLVSP